jgi:ABC-type uncharacterized transport system substrate-binding protein
VISRRALVGNAVLAMLTTRLAGIAEAAGKPWRIGWLDSGSTSAYREAPFVTALKETGYAEGRDFVVEVQHAEGQFDRLPALATDLVGRKVNLVVAYGDPAIHAAKEATNTIPIVMLSSADPVGLGFVASLSRPGGNITGVSDLAAELVNKQLDFLRQAVPKLHQVVVVTSAIGGAKERARQLTLQAAQAFHLALTIEEVPGPSDARRIFAAMTDHLPDGVIVVGGQVIDGSTRIEIAKLSSLDKIPLVSDTALMIPWGALMSYQASYGPQARRAAWYAEKILNGVKPADLPVEQPTEIRLIVNLETAKAIGVTIPQSLLMLANQVIE